MPETGGAAALGGAGSAEGAGGRRASLRSSLARSLGPVTTSKSNILDLRVGGRSARWDFEFGRVWKRESRLDRGGFGISDECAILSRRCEPAAVIARELRDLDRA